MKKNKEFKVNIRIVSDSIILLMAIIALLYICSEMEHIYSFSKGKPLYSKFPLGIFMGIICIPLTFIFNSIASIAHTINSENLNALRDFSRFIFFCCIIGIIFFIIQILFLLL